MTQAPWSVKGIDPKARSAARERAERRGVTLGQYLNSLLLDDFPDSAGEIDIRTIDTSDRDPEALKRISAEVDRLAQKLDATHLRSSRAVAGIDKSILGLLGKLEESGKSQSEVVEQVKRFVQQLEGAQTALHSRIESLEAESRSGPTVSALKSLEAALSRLSEGVQARTRALEVEQADIRELFEDRVSKVSEQVEGFARSLDSTVSSAVRSSSAPLTERLDQIEGAVTSVQRRMEGAFDRMSDAASRFELLETKAERAVSDTTWRMERALESTIGRSRTMSKELLDRVDAMEERTRGAVSALGDAMARIIDRMGRAERASQDTAQALQRSILSLDERLSQSERTPAPEIERLQATFQKRLDALADDLSRPIQAVRHDLEKRIEDVSRDRGQDRSDHLERALKAMQDRLSENEGRQSEAVATMGAQVDRLSRAVDDRLRTVEARDPSRSIEDVRREMLQLADRIEARIGAAENDARSSARNADAVRDLFSRMGETVDEQFKDLEKRSASAIDAVGEQVALVAERLQKRHEDDVRVLSSRIEQAAAEGGGLSTADLDNVVRRIDDRVQDSERRSADAIGQMGEQVARMGERLQSQQETALRTIEERLSESDRTHKSRLTDALADMSRRLDEIGEAGGAALAPIHKTVSSIAQRVAEIEDRGAPGQPARITTAPPAADPDDDIFVIEDAAPRTSRPNVESAAALDNDDDLAFVSDPDAVLALPGGEVGVEPPPFDADLFAEQSTGVSPAGIETIGIEEYSADDLAGGPGADANELDDLLDTDDMILEDASIDASFVGDLPPLDQADRPSAAYLEEARRAARHGRRIAAAPSGEIGRRRGIGRGPLVASTALALAVAAGGAYTVMRGKQEPASNDTLRQDPAAPQAAEGDPEAAASLLFADPAASEAGAADDMLEPVPAPAETTGSVAPAAAPPPAAQPVSLAEAAQDGDPVAMHDYALELLQAGERTRAVSLLKDAANDGLVMAQYRLAKLYERGEGVPRDIAQSRAWTEKAAIGGNTKAMHDLAVFFAEGDAGPQSYSAAVEWFRQASEHGLVDSQYNLAVLFEQGLGVSVDRTEAAYWFEVAGRAGDRDAVRKAQSLFAQLPPAEAEQIRRRARAYNPKPGIPLANGSFGVRSWEQPSATQKAEIQRLLKSQGYTGPVSEAVRSFERERGLPVTGEPTVSLLKQLQAAALAPVQ